MLRQIVKQAGIALLKLGVLYLLLPLLIIDWILFRTALPRYLQIWEAFLGASCVYIGIGLILSLALRSRTPVLFAIFSVGFALALQEYMPQADVFVAIFLCAATINFFHRNRLTEPLLVLLPIFALTWIFVHIICGTYTYAWVLVKTQKMGLIDAFLTALPDLELFFGNVGITLPVLAVYALGKHAYLPLFARCAAWLRARRGQSTAA